MDDSRHENAERPGDSRVTLSALLERAYVFQITDPRDKVYALLGLGPRWAQQVITVDYNSELSAVYKQTTRAILEQDHALAPWSRAGLSYQRQQDLPSWVADWSSFFPHCQYSSETLGIPDRASGDSQVDVQWPFADDDSNLQTKSYKVATISQVGQKVIEKRAYSDQTFAPHELVAEAAHVLVMRTSLPLGETDTLDAFLRIWIGDHTGIIPTIPAPKSALEASNTLLLDQMLAANNEDVAAVAGDNFCLREMLLLYLETAQRPKSEVYTTPLPYAALIANRRFFITAEGYFGLGPLSTLPGDDVHIVSGGKTPYIIRPLEAPDGHALVSDAYVQELMAGEALESPGFRWQDLFVQ
ncbi:uncharacterized protein CLAFUR5_05811 [Fulvia fulva]|uniref:Uncharacterized protein n=1 Tax=Passalora fulva TaxID=5499 RepID=A0A9Q8LGW5_PASFU|nr:uncharacterized protein CLAFUR5_05811 [Fulvia fulva]KAK4625159.1 hypothetical protein CLAFUR0_05672 [Fulvia fulva]UJO17227.1 hypothetical protein CLAFUR5_05811 [Fulvia fulva]